MLDRLYECFRRLRERPAWREHVSGGVGSVEIKLSKLGRWHVHVHCIVEGSYFPQRLLSQEWLAVTGDSSIVDIRPAGQAEARYVAKYIGKPVSSIVHLPDDRLDQVVEGLRGRRLMFAWGTWFARLREDDDDDIEGDDAGVWEPIAPLPELLERAARGDTFARDVIDQLRPGTSLRELFSLCSDDSG